MSDRPLTESPASEEIQGNILVGFNKPNMHFVLLQLSATPARCRAWLAAMIPELAFSGEVAHSKARRDMTWVGLGLTRTGLERLGVPTIAADFGQTSAFVAGAWTRGDRLGDVDLSAAVNWNFGNEARRVDAVVTVAADDPPQRAEPRLRQVRRIARDHAVRELDTLSGTKLTGGKEHFGFRDGIGQPLIRRFADPADRPAEQIEPGEFVLGWPAEPPGRRDPPAWLRNASFQVLRQLEQDVAGWKRDGDATGDLATWGGHRVGRATDGTPIVPTPPDAHIRKTSPGTRNMRVLRRGIPYGPPFDDAPHEPRGLVFNAFMASIERQFERAQRAANHPGPEATTGPDAVIGVPDPRARWAGRRGPTWPRYVSTRGSLYAIALSRSGLRDVARSA